jgi:hypothetical protein
MIRKEPTRSGDKVKVTFVIPDEGGASEVFLTGDFNTWSVGETLMRRREGVRSASLTLVAGRRYAFRYYQDGHWFNDEAADDYVVNEFGEQNGIVDLRWPQQDALAAETEEPSRAGLETTPAYNSTGRPM